MDKIEIIEDLISKDGEKKSKGESMGDRMKGYEAEWSRKLDPKLPFIMRLDGHKFSSYTKPFKKPFDERINNVMVATTMDLMTTFNATTAYTCSDEITLLFPPVVNGEEENKEEIKEATDENDEKKKKKKKERRFHIDVFWKSPKDSFFGCRVRIC